MSGLTEGILAAQVLLVLGGFAFAAVADLRTREVTDALWQGLGVLGGTLGAVVVAPGGAFPLGVWLVVAALTVEHMFPWDVRLGPRLERYADLLELGAYVAVVVFVGGAAARFGIGPNGVPVPALAVLASVLFARGLFEAGVLYGGADAKALMTAGILVPLFPNPVFSLTSSALSVTTVLPFSVNLLMDAALFSVAVPIGIAVRNLSRGEFHSLRDFTGYTIPTTELPRRFVWVRDPTLGLARKDEEGIETSEDDRRRRSEIARELESRGVSRVWVTPQIPFLALMAAGAVAALLAGNLVTDLIFSV